jgi:seryl-tRNA synthetase
MTAPQTEKTFLEQLFEHKLLIPTANQGIYGRSQIFEDVVQRLEERIVAIGRDPGTEILHFPPVMSQEIVEKSGYLKSFPHLLGSIHSFMGNHRQHAQMLQELEEQQDWSHHYTPAGLVMTPAACYPVYSAVAGTLPEGGRLIEVSSYCFRHEPSLEPARMQIFRMREFVRIGEPELVQHWREAWIGRGRTFLSKLGLQAIAAPANDPFFGPGGRLLAASQQEQELKFELLAPVNSEQATTAVMSFNYHQDHFGHKFDIQTADGNVAHTACTGFGLERITLGLFRAHGLNVAEWPQEVKKRLWHE